jgi:hypothetical protein
MFILKNLIIEAKLSNLILNCESSEAKRKCLIAKRTCLYLKKLDIEAKRTRSIVRKFISKRSEYIYIKEFNDRSEAK